MLNSIIIYRINKTVLADDVHKEAGRKSGLPEKSVTEPGPSIPSTGRKRKPSQRIDDDAYKQKESLKFQKNCSESRPDQRKTCSCQLEMDVEKQFGQTVAAVLYKLTPEDRLQCKTKISNILHKSKDSDVEDAEDGFGQYFTTNNDPFLSPPGPSISSTGRKCKPSQRIDDDVYKQKESLKFQKNCSESRPDQRKTCSCQLEMDVEERFGQYVAAVMYKLTPEDRFQRKTKISYINILHKSRLGC